jgi:OmpA-OmpF porin, OOP family
MTLSQHRAEAVAAALRPQLRGVQVTLHSRGYGETNPVASNATEAGRQRNRRVTIVLPRR